VRAYADHGAIAPQWQVPRQALQAIAVEGAKTGKVILGHAHNTDMSHFRVMGAGHRQAVDDNTGTDAGTHT